MKAIDIKNKLAKKLENIKDDDDINITLNYVDGFTIKKETYKLNQKVYCIVIDELIPCYYESYKVLSGIIIELPKQYFANDKNYYVKLKDDSRERRQIAQHMLFETKEKALEACIHLNKKELSDNMNNQNYPKI